MRLGVQPRTGTVDDINPCIFTRNDQRSIGKNLMNQIINNFFFAIELVNPYRKAEYLV